MRFSLLATLLFSLPVYAVPCVWDAGTIPATVDNGQFNTLICGDDIIINGSIDLNAIALADPEKPLLIESSGTFTLQSGFSLTLNGGDAAGTFGGVGTLSGGAGGSIVGCLPENGIGYPKPIGADGAGNGGSNGNAAEAGGGGGGGSFLSGSSTNGGTINAAGGSRGSLITNALFNFETLFFGGNGGGAGGCGNANATSGSAGGSGAGALKIVANNIIFEANSSITANGGSGANATAPGAGGGGGSGGAIYLVSQQNIQFAANVTINALGGTAGTGGASGGVGDIGAIRLDYSGSIIGNGQISPTPTLIGPSTQSTQTQLIKFSSDISCGVVARQEESSSWQIVLGFMLAALLIKRKKTANF
jgi:hypothetical protein